jgi:hypothetical protein
VTGIESVGQPPLPVVVERWRRYGHDRAYVRVDGVQVGYRDLKSTQVHCEEPSHAVLVAGATAHMVRGQQLGGATHDVPRHIEPGEDREPPVSLPVAEETENCATPSSDSRLLPDGDLALNAPGGAARTQALALREAAPVRTLLARIVGAKTDERNWRIGADAEVEVARRLMKLGPEWRVLHAVPVGENGSDIDHVVIGPAGVFTINTKHHPDANVWVRGDTFKVNGQNQHYVRNSRFEARRAAELLSAKALFEVDVRAVIAVMGAHGGFAVKEQPRDGIVTVVTRKAVESHLRSLPVVLGAASIERIYEVGRHLATWQPKAVRWAEL